jgi:hypothetical protein
VKISSVALGQILAEVDLTFRVLQVGGLPFVRGVLVIFSRTSVVVLAAAVILAALPGPLNGPDYLAVSDHIVRELFTTTFVSPAQVTTIFVLVTEKYRGIFTVPLFWALLSFWVRMTLVFPSMPLDPFDLASSCTNLMRVTTGLIRQFLSLNPCLLTNALKHETPRSAWRAGEETNDRISPFKWNLEREPAYEDNEYKRLADFNSGCASGAVPGNQHDHTEF